MSQSSEMTKGNRALRFDDSDALTRLEAMAAEELDTLDFGVIRMDAEATVVAYNRFESERSTVPRERVLGRNLFLQVAPCTNNYMVAQRYLDCERLDETIQYVFTFVVRPTAVWLRLLKAPTTHQYLLVATR